MKLLLIHLSDIHVTGPSDPILGRGDKIVDAVKNLDYDVDLCVVAITGDIAFSGKELEYFYAWELIDGIAKDLNKTLHSSAVGIPVPVFIVPIPGNHDCDFDRSGGARNIIVDGVLKNQAQARDSSVLDLCLKEQTSFFEFLDVYGKAGEAELKGRAYDRKLYYEYHFPVNGKIIRFLCCNTAWLSRLRETQGQLFFPSDAIPNVIDNYALTVALFHHPYNWLEANSGRAFRKRIEQVADLILTGHEHDATRRSQEGGGGERNIYVEGGALQDAEHPDSSTFNAFVLDLATRKQKFVNLLWDKELFHPPVGMTNGRDGAGLAWEDFQVSRLRQRARFEISEDMQQILDDPGVTLTHRSKGILKLSDIFVFPELREALAGKDLATVVRGDHIVDLVAKSSHLLITGDNQCGKTSLGKALFRKLHEAGSVPILLSGDRRFPADDAIFGELEAIFATQYDPEALNAYRQIDTSRRVIIVDDYHKLIAGKSKKKRILSGLAKFAGKIILLADDMVIVEGLAKPEEKAPGDPRYSHYRIQPFGFTRRSLLVERWLMLDPDVDDDSAAFAHQLTTITGHLDTLLGTNFVPAYPVYIISVLQASEAATPLDMRASTHGYFYELFIKTALALGQNKIELDVTASYLAFLAHEFFRRHLRQADEATLKEIHQAYEDKHDIKRVFDSIRAQLKKQHMLVDSGGQFTFKYKYLYYYFVASYMRDHISEAETRQNIRTMSRALYVDENANILLFLAHLSKDPVIIEEMLLAADDLYTDLPAAIFLDDAAFLAKVEEVSDEFIYYERDVKIQRREMLEKLDQEAPYAADDEAPVDSVRAQLDPVVRMNVALKTLQILGQILKNFIGSMEGQTKLKIARSCFDLGLRATTSVFKLVHENEDDIVRHIVEIVRERYPDYQNEELQRRARKTITGMTRIACYSIVKRISYAVGSPDLAATYDKLIEEQRTPARELIRASIMLDHTEEDRFPSDHIEHLEHELRGNYLGLWLLRRVVLNHFYLFPVTFDVRQKTCETLGISYSRLQVVDPERKLITRAKEHG